MERKYNGHYEYDASVIKSLESNLIGVYYCGTVNSQNRLIPSYIGVGTSERGVRGRLLDHIGENKWLDVTHFGFYLCNTPAEAENFETEEIAKHKPKYNLQGK